MSNLQIVNEEIGKHIQEALQLRDLEVRSVQIQFSPGAPISATVELWLTKEQIANLLKGIQPE